MCKIFHFLCQSTKISEWYPTKMCDLKVWELHLCKHVHTSLPYTMQSQHFLIMRPTAQPKTAVVIIYESRVYITINVTKCYFKGIFAVTSVGRHSNSQVGPDTLNWSTLYLVGIQRSVMAALIPSLWPLTHFLGIVTVAVGGVG